MADEWPIVQLGDVTNLLTGFPFRSVFYTDDPSAPRLLRGDNIAQGVLRWDGVKRWPKDATGDVETYWLKEGDVILAMDRPWIEAGLKYAAVRESDLPILLVQRVACLRGTKALDTAFLKHVIGSRAFTEHVLAVQTGTAVPHISGAQIKSFAFGLPRIEEQRAIAHILGTLDDKIELNRRMNETLEEMARTLFKSWFVDFDPVRAKAEGRNPGLPKPFADLFPDSFEDSELGEIPKGWKVKQIGDSIERLPVGQKYEQKTVNQISKVPVLDQGKSGVIGYHDDAPGVVASIDAPVVVFANHTCYMRLIHFSFSAIQNVLPFIGKGVDTVWAFYATYGKQSFNEYKGHWPDFVIHKIAVPDQKITTEFARLVQPLLKQTWMRESETRTLSTLRDTLLPKLISGELRVKNIERFMRGVVA